MKLPTLELPIHSIELPVSKQKLNIKPYVIKDEKSLITSLTDTNDLSIFKRLIETCVLDDINIDTLAIDDFMFLIIMIRLKSIGEIITSKLQCEHCLKYCEIDINIEDSLKVINDLNSSVLKIHNELAIELNHIKVKPFMSGKTDNLELFASAISKVIFQNNVYTDFTSEDLIENILGNLTSTQFELISTEINKFTKLIIDIKFTCYHCKSENSIIENKIINFL